MSWNEALSTWDEQIEVMREVHEAYLQHLEGLVRGLKGGVLNDEGFGRMECVADFKVRGYPAAIQARAWPTCPWGGVAGQVAVGISLDPSLIDDEAFPGDFGALCSALQVKRGPMDRGRLLIKRGRVPLEEKGGKRRVEQAWLEALDEAPKLARKLSELSRATPYQWLRCLLLELVKSSRLEDSGPDGTRTSGRLGDWAGGRQFTVYAEALPQVFFTVVPDGRLLMHFGYKRRTTAEQAELVCAALGLIPMEIDGYAGGVLMNKEETLAAFEGEDSGEIKRRIMAAWTAYQDALST